MCHRAPSNDVKVALRGRGAPRTQRSALSTDALLVGQRSRRLTRCEIGGCSRVVRVSIACVTEQVVCAGAFDAPDGARDGGGPILVSRIGRHISPVRRLTSLARTNHRVPSRVHLQPRHLLKYRQSTHFPFLAMSRLAAALTERGMGSISQ